MSELLRILEVGEALLTSDRTLAGLLEISGSSRASVMRRLGELRNMGCKIVSVREAGRSVYRLENPSEVCGRLMSWARLERDRDLRAGG